MGFYINNLIRRDGTEDPSVQWIYHQHYNGLFCIALKFDDNYFADGCNEKVPTFVIMAFENLVEESINDYYEKNWKLICSIPLNRLCST